jgi:hypothetical protein
MIVRESLVVSETGVTTNPHGKTKPSIFRSRMYPASTPYTGCCKEKMAPKTGRFGLSVRVGGRIVRVRRVVVLETTHSNVSFHSGLKVLFFVCRVV